MRQNREPSTLSACVLLSVIIGMLCGAAFYTCSVELQAPPPRFVRHFTPFTIWHAAVVGGAAGIFFAMWIVWALHNGTVIDAAKRAVPAAVCLAVLLSVFNVHPTLATLVIAVSVIIICRISATKNPARRPINLSVCSSCEYDLTGVTGATCPECGEERIVPRASTRAPEERA